MGEPTGLKLAVGHRGVVAFEVTFFGESVHAARHYEGKNAITAAARLIELVNELDRDMRDMKPTALGHASAAATKIFGGTKANVVPERCVVQIDRRMISGDTKESCILQMEKLLNKVKDEVGCAWECGVIACTPPSLVEDSSPVLARIDECFKRIYGRTQEHVLFSATCEAGFFMEKGIPTVVLGPGDITQAHNTDEYVLISQLEEGAKIYAGLAVGLLIPELL